MSWDCSGRRRGPRGRTTRSTRWPARGRRGACFGSTGGTDAHAQLSGTVLRAGRRRNTVSGLDFVVARVRTYGGEVTVCLSAEEHEVPAPGNVLSGMVFLVASTGPRRSPRRLECFAAVADEVLRRPAGSEETRRANAAFWDAHAPGYQRDHGAEMAGGFLWCPDGVREDDARLLGDVRGRRVLDIGCGAAQTTRWLRENGADAVGFDLSHEQLRLGGLPGVVCADAEALPFGDATFDAACSAYGALPFVADSARVMREVARVLRPGGLFVFSVTHPFRWCFPDSEDGLTVTTPYFDRTPYVEQAAGTATYVEHHRTLGDRVREAVAAGLAVLDVVEPEWPEGHTTTYPQWGPRRGRLIPGTAIFVTRRQP